MAVKWGERHWGDFKWGEPSSKIVINGIEEFIFHGLIIEDILTSEINTANFGIIKTAASRPITGQIIEIWHNADKIFTGRISTVTENKIDKNNFDYNCSCVDYTVDLDKKLVNEQYGTDSLYDIITDIMTNYTTGFTLTNVINPGPDIAGITFVYEQVSSCIKKICDITGYDWYIDVNRDLHIFNPDTGEENAPIEILDNGTEFEDLVIDRDSSQIRNKIYVRGDSLSGAYTQDTITAGAGQTEFKLNYFAHGLSVTVDGNSKTIGIENIDLPGGHHFLFNYNEKLVKVDTIAMVGGEAVIFSYIYEKPILCVTEDAESIDNMATIDGEDGIYEFYIPDESLTGVSMAQERAKAELIKYANPILSGSFKTFVPGFKSGQILHINLASRDMAYNANPLLTKDKYCTIRKVTASMIGGNQLQYAIEFGSYTGNLNTLLINLLDKTREKKLRTDEILNKLSHVKEECFLDEVIQTTLV